MLGGRRLLTSLFSLLMGFINKVGLGKACKRAGIEDFTFHDLRHTAINNWRLQGHDYFRIMAASGHKTMSVFKRYNTVSKKELQAMVHGNSG
jgi:integrase